MMLVLYTEYAGKLRLLAIYYDGTAFERRLNFQPYEIGVDEEKIKSLLESNPVFFGKTFRVETDKEIDKEAFGKAISDLLELKGDEYVLYALAKMQKAVKTSES